MRRVCAGVPECSSTTTTRARWLCVLGATAMAHDQGTPSLALPSVGLGLWKSKPGEVHDAVKEALRLGYRLLDGAAAYGNEEEVGGAVAEALSEGIVRREELWVRK